MSDGATRTLLALLAAPGPWAPTVRELAAATGAAPSTVLLRLRELRTAGLVVWVDGRARTLRPLVRAVASCEQLTRRC